jgi:hypothetical protein
MKIIAFLFTLSLMFLTGCETLPQSAATVTSFAEPLFAGPQAEEVNYVRIFNDFPGGIKELAGSVMYRLEGSKKWEYERIAPKGSGEVKTLNKTIYEQSLQHTATSKATIAYTGSLGIEAGSDDKAEVRVEQTEQAVALGVRDPKIKGEIREWLSTMKGRKIAEARYIYIARDNVATSKVYKHITKKGKLDFPVLQIGRETYDARSALRVTTFTDAVTSVIGTPR